MECRVCGYMMPPFEKECARCRMLGRDTPHQTAPPSSAPYVPGPLDFSGSPYPQSPPSPQSGGFGAGAAPYAPAPAYSSPAYIPLPTSPSSHHKASNTGKVAGISAISLICILLRIGLRVYIQMERNSRSNTSATQPYSSGSYPSGYPSQGFTAPLPSSQADASMPRTTTTYQMPAYGRAQFGPTNGQFAAENARAQMNQSLQRVQQMQQENMARMQQMQENNLQRMQQMRSQMPQPGFPPNGMRPGWPGR